MDSPAAIRDELVASMQYNRPTVDAVGIHGTLIAELRGSDGKLKARSVSHNLVTSAGDQYYAGRASLSSGLPAQVTCMKLGSGSTAVSKTGAGAALTTYLAGSDKAMDATYPTAVAGVVSWQVTYGPGVATTASPITEAVLVTDTLADATSTAANTISRAPITNISAKGASDSLTLSWTHTLLGA